MLKYDFGAFCEVKTTLSVPVAWWHHHSDHTQSSGPADRCAGIRTLTPRGFATVCSRSSDEVCNLWFTNSQLLTVVAENFDPISIFAAS